MGGISRSPAVAKFLGDYVYKVKTYPTKTYNKYVYSMLEKEWLEQNV